MEITEILRKLEQGKANPYLCVAEDKRQYVVKGRSATSRGMISEYLCAKLGQDFGLPIPECKILDLSYELVEIDSNWERHLGGGPVFGSMFIAQTQEVNREIISKIHHQVLRDLRVFDYWIKNDDRNFTPIGGNPNLFFRSQDEMVVVVDHNLAFDTKFDLESFKKLHVSANAGLRQELAGVMDEDYKQRMNQAMDNFDGYCDNLPPVWLDADSNGSGWVAHIKRQLLEFKEDLFWEALK
ncbi:hypothetical protein QWI17_19105 [Gilvimarinus sp. SDUM040013]|uniref:HipA family kinase n=1 Tax=Gilvimarinus gilvus TaxID=3058038 RepID=A0ABU4RUW5_9GAMM|nr:HipA family kinase [Gilvimarinus sp. SDUM040013]MDO3387961.1 hypothetical protein [Gilvimarinus sp. SDUM040013]MDX6848668.1 HipA family kinase [Gilvimarinus sp. SDUM040013]